MRKCPGSAQHDCPVERQQNHGTRPRAGSTNQRGKVESGRARFLFIRSFILNQQTLPKIVDDIRDDEKTADQ